MSKDEEPVFAELEVSGQVAGPAEFDAGFACETLLAEVFFQRSVIGTWRAEAADDVLDGGLEGSGASLAKFGGEGEEKPETHGEGEGLVDGGVVDGFLLLLIC